MVLSLLHVRVTFVHIVCILHTHDIPLAGLSARCFSGATRGALSIFSLIIIIVRMIVLVLFHNVTSLRTHWGHIALYPLHDPKTNR